MSDNQEGLRGEIAEVLELVAKDGLPGPRDLDVALDAIMCSVKGRLIAMSNEVNMPLNINLEEL